MRGLALAGDDLVGDVRGGLDQREVALALEPLLDDLHVEHAQEAAAEAEPERVGRLRLEREARVVERQLLQGRAEVVELVVGRREQAAEDDRHRLLVARQGDLGRPRAPAVIVSPIRTSESRLILAMT